MEIVTRKTAQAEGKPTYFTGKPCGRGHVAPRRVDSCSCLMCRKEDGKAAFARDADKIRAHFKAIDTPERQAKRSKDYWDRHREKLKERRRVAYLADPERHRAYSRKWAKANPDKIRAKTARAKTTC